MQSQSSGSLIGSDDRQLSIQPALGQSWSWSNLLNAPSGGGPAAIAHRLSRRSQAELEAWFISEDGGSVDNSQKGPDDNGRDADAGAAPPAASLVQDREAGPAGDPASAPEAVPGTVPAAVPEGAPAGGTAGGPGSSESRPTLTARPLEVGTRRGSEPSPDLPMRVVRPSLVQRRATLTSLIDSPALDVFTLGGAELCGVTLAIFERVGAFTNGFCGSRGAR